MSETLIPFNRTSFDSGELARIQEAVENGHISGDGPFSKKAEKILSDMHDGSRVLLTPSCSHALELAARLLGFEPGDEVIVPSFTFVTSVSSFVSNGAVPVFCDIDPVTLGLDLKAAEKLITKRTKAIVLVHYNGVPANPEGFARLAAVHGLVLIEDNAHGLGGTSDGKKLGAFGALSTLSFHETKNITCGEGGALVLNDPQYVERAEILREKGTDRSLFFQGRVDRYTWRDLGSSWVLSDILSAILYAQLSKFEEIQARRVATAKLYFEALKDWAATNDFVLQKWNLGTSHLFFVLLDESVAQVSLIDHMKKRGVAVVSHYQPLHQSAFGSRFVGHNSSLPVTEAVSRALIRLPLFPGFAGWEQERVISALLEFPRESKTLPRLTEVAPLPSFQ